MILIADSGSTKTDWCVVDGQETKQCRTSGTNPVFQSGDEIQKTLVEELLPQIGDSAPDAVYFYGAGCGSPDKIKIVRCAIADTLKVKGEIEVNSDMLSAARALCGHESGIACIIGTGSNSCFYDGERIVKNISPLGFILGDEGSGAVLGKHFIGNLLKGQLSKTVEKRFDDIYGLKAEDIIDRVYRCPFPNRFLASLSPFILDNISDATVHEMVLESFISFIERNVKHYDCKQYAVHFTGSIAYHYREVLEEAAARTGIRIGQITNSPLEGLVNYHKSIGRFATRVL
jgi:N-acetylglucosamine kinase-like BadF-type ATPase